MPFQVEAIGFRDSARLPDGSNEMSIVIDTPKFRERKARFEWDPQTGLMMEWTAQGRGGALVQRMYVPPANVRWIHLNQVAEPEKPKGK